MFDTSRKCAPAAGGRAAEGGAPGRLRPLLLAGLITMLAGCATLARTSHPPAVSDVALRIDAPTTPAARPADRPTVALVMKTLTNPFFVEMERGARRAEAELNINLVVRTGSQETSIDQQIAIVDELVAQGVDAIVIAPGSSTELIPALVLAQQRGLTIVNIDNRLDPDLAAAKGLTGVPFVSVDNEKGAYLAMRRLLQEIDGPGEVALLEGIRSARNAQARRQGALRALAERPDLQLIASETADWKIDVAYDVTSALLDKHPSIRGIFAANDMMALGALQHLEDRGMPMVKVAGFDALEPARAAVAAGRLVATVNQRGDEQGYLGVQYAVRLMRGEVVPPETFVEVELIDEDE